MNLDVVRALGHFLTCNVDTVNIKCFVYSFRPIWEALIIGGVAQTDNERNTLVQNDFLQKSPSFGSNNAFADYNLVHFLIIQGWNFEDSCGWLIDICSKYAPVVADVALADFCFFTGADH